MKKFLGVIGLILLSLIVLFNCQMPQDIGSSGGSSNGSSTATAKTSSISGKVSIDGATDLSGCVIIAEKEIAGVTLSVLNTLAENSNNKSLINIPAVTKSLSLNSKDFTAGNILASTSTTVYTAVTDAIGNYTIPNVPEGNYTITFSKANTLGAVKSGIPVIMFAPAIVDVVLTATGSISGTVTLAGSSTALLGTFVYAEGTSFIAGTAFNGGFVISNIPIGTYDIIIYHDKYQTIEIPGVVVTAANITTVGINDMAFVGQAPVINTIDAYPLMIKPGESTTLTASASDPDGQALTYTWSCADGTLSSVTGNPVTWTSPTTTEGTFRINLTVSDGTNTVNGSVNVISMPYDNTAPANVTGLMFTAGYTKITFTWTGEPTDIDFANVEITATPAITSVTIPKGVKTATITGLTNGTSYTFTIKSVDTAGNKSTGTPVDATPCPILYVSNSTSIIQFNGLTGAYLNGTLANSSLTPIPGTGLAVNPTANILYLTLGTGGVTYIDATTGAYLNGTFENSSFMPDVCSWDITINPSTNILYLLTSPVIDGYPGRITYFNATTGAYLNGSFENSNFYGSNVLFNVAVNPSANILYAATTSGTITYFNATTGAYINGTLANSSFSTGSSSNDVAVNPSANILYVINGATRTVTYFNATTGAYINGTLANSSFATGTNPWGIEVNPTANILYVINETSNTVTYFNATSGAYLNGTLANSSFSTGTRPYKPAVNPTANILYVINTGSNTVTYFNATTGAYLNGTLANSSFSTETSPYGGIAVWE